MTALKKLGENYKEEEKEVEVAGRKVIVRITTYAEGSQRVHAFFSDKNMLWLVKRNNELLKRIIELEKKEKGK